MARVSKRDKIAELNADNPILHETAVITYNTAIYSRLSVEDNAAGKRGDTLNTQIHFIKKYLEDKPYLNHVMTFSDNGFTGTNFNRPGFEKLMEAVRNGEINCIVVKDFSRFGRNYIETESYVENVFPFMGVRFISVNDNYDSNNPEDRKNSFSRSIKYLINEHVARDISKKVSSTFKMQREKGYFTGAHAPYGYLKAQDDKHRFIVDTEAASVVLWIFKMRAEGKSLNDISLELNFKNIDCPIEYKIRKGIIKPKPGHKECIWQKNNLKRMLEDVVYIGHMQQGGNCHSKFEDKNSLLKQVNTIVTVENTHEPIVPIELWDAVREINEQAKEEYNKLHPNQPTSTVSKDYWLKGKIFCGDCGYAIKRQSDYYANGKKRYLYGCRHQEKDGSYCEPKQITQPKLYDILYKMIRVQMNLCVEYKKIVSKLERDERITKLTERTNNERKQLIQRISDINKRKILLYDDYAEGNISRDDYIMIGNKYNEEHEKLSQRLSEVELIIANKEVMLSQNNDWITAFDKFRRQRKLSKEMVDLLVKRVVFVGKYEFEVEFNFKDQFEALVRGLSELQEEAVSYE